MSGIPDYINNPNYNPNHSDWYPGKRDQVYRDNFDRIFQKTKTDKEESVMGCGKPKPRPR